VEAGRIQGGGYYIRGRGERGWSKLMASREVLGEERGETLFKRGGTIPNTKGESTVREGRRSDPGLEEGPWGGK